MDTAMRTAQKARIGRGWTATPRTKRSRHRTRVDSCESFEPSPGSGDALSLRRLDVLFKPDDPDTACACRDTGRTAEEGEGPAPSQYSPEDGADQIIAKGTAGTSARGASVPAVSISDEESYSTPVSLNT